MEKPVTAEDLQKFKEEFFLEITALLHERGTIPVRRWIVVAEVEKIFSLSRDMIFDLRKNGKLRYVRIGKSIFLEYDDVVNMMESQSIIEIPPSEKVSKQN